MASHLSSLVATITTHDTHVSLFVALGARHMRAGFAMSDHFFYIRTLKHAAVHTFVIELT
jgi:hypothetical protein